MELSSDENLIGGEGDVKGTYEGTADNTYKNELSFEKLCMPMYQELLAYVTRRTFSHEKAQDIVHNALERALRTWHRWEPDGDPEVKAKGWLYRLTSNEFKRKFVGDKIYRELTESKQPTDLTSKTRAQLYPEDHVEQHIQDTNLATDLECALAQIKPEMAEVIVAIYLDDLSEEETAAKLGVPRGTVRSRMSRGRLALVKLLGPVAKEVFGEEYQYQVVERKIGPSKKAKQMTQEFLNA